MIINISNERNMVDFNNIISDMKVKTNMVTSNSYHLDSSSKCHLFNSHCLSLYGCELFNLENKLINTLYTTWRKCCRRVLMLPYRTHGRFLHNIFKTNQIDDILMQRIFNFLLKGINHDNEMVKYVFRNSIFSYSSYFARNLNIIKTKYKLEQNREFDKAKFKVKTTENTEEIWKLNMIHEILSSFNGDSFIQIDRGILDDIFDFL